MLAVGAQWTYIIIPSVYLLLVQPEYTNTIIGP